jgi:hypothetical protein
MFAKRGKRKALQAVEIPFSVTFFIYNHICMVSIGEGMVTGTKIA